MNVKEVERIKNLIQDAELSNAKSQGIIENIQKEWKDEFGTDKLEDVEKELKKLQEELKQSDDRLKQLEKKLNDSYDWDKLEEELE